MVIDTSAYIALQKGIKGARQALADVNVIVVPVIVIGELRYGFLNGSMLVKNEEVLQKFLATEEVQTADVILEATPDYAELYWYAKRKGKVLSHNDLWIASIAKQLNLPLLTLDRDFEALRPKLPAGLYLVK